MSRVEIEIDVEEHLDQIPDRVLIDALMDRRIGEKFPWNDIVTELRAAFHARDAIHFDVLLNRLRPIDDFDSAARIASYEYALNADLKQRSSGRPRRGETRDQHSARIARDAGQSSGQSSIEGNDA